VQQLGGIALAPMARVLVASGRHSKFIKFSVVMTRKL
jgi:hypothetical protein